MSIQISKNRIILTVAGTAAMFLAACGGSSTSTPTSVATVVSSATASATNTPVPASPTATTSATATGAATAVATSAPIVEGDTTRVEPVRSEIPTLKGRSLSAQSIDIDQQTHLLYLADKTTNGLDIFDISGKNALYVKTISMPSGPNGVLIVKPLNKIFVSLNSSAVAVIDIAVGSDKKDNVIATVDTGGAGRADAMDYDPNTNKVYVVNNDDGMVTSIDAGSNTIIKKFNTLGAALRQIRYNPKDGMMYMASADQNALFRFDPRTDNLAEKIDVVDRCLPIGLAINPTTNQALLGCSAKSQHTAVWDFASKKVVMVYTNVGGTDEVMYDVKVNLYFTASYLFASGPMIGIFDGKDGRFITNVPAQTGSHQIAYDETNRILYTTQSGLGGLIGLPLPVVGG